MPRMDPVARMQERAKSKAHADNVMGKSPIQRIGVGIITAVENVRGLNIGGPQRGRLAREKANKKYQKSLKKTEKFAP